MVKQEVDFGWESHKIIINYEAIYKKGGRLNLNLDDKINYVL